MEPYPINQVDQLFYLSLMKFFLEELDLIELLHNRADQLTT
jgi:hypothetical protein